MGLVASVRASVTGLSMLHFAASRHESDARQGRMSPPGRMVDIGGTRLHLHIEGEGKPGPTVILDAGMVSFSSNWAWVQPQVAESAPVIAYDRAGLGWSDKRPGPRDAMTSARELHTALKVAGVQSPFVLAGHSYGGLVVRAFAELYRDEVVGMVLVDASHPDQWNRFGVKSAVPAFGNKVSSFLARLGFFRVFNGEYKLLANGLPPQQYAELMHLATTSQALSTAGDALKVWDSLTRPFINGAASLGELPLIVLSVTEQPRMGEKLTQLQAELPGLSSNCQHITVRGAYHEGLVSQPDHARIVADAILRVVEAARTGIPLGKQPPLPTEA